MTTKDHKLISEALKKGRDKQAFNQSGSVYEAVAYQLAQCLKKDNPKFDIESFLEDCGLNAD